MAVLKKLQDFLDQHGVSYTHTVHPLAYTARAVASAEHIPAQEVAKTLVFLVEDGYRMVVLPASKVVDFQELRAMLGFSHARLATEKELAQIFPDCELGAMPPFGNLYGLEVYLDSTMLADEKIAFNAGTHRDVLHMSLKDYRRLVNPEIASLARQLAAQRGW
ncbi:MAG TPA: YbaK/EbsC family protein [Bryobacteraceae bacterium]|jgi:Ala-tRNA(Pro) deacylase|nr:YbaK/EbsC family protein [Bryobacteraceae bacterium]